MKTTPQTDLSQIDQLKALLAAQDATLLKQEAKISAQSGEIFWLKEQLGLSRINQFGSSSEKHPAQNDLFNEAETCESIEPAEQAPATETIDGYQRKKPGRKPLPEDLPRERIVHDLADDDKTCDCYGNELHQVGEEISEQLDIVPAKVRVLQHVKLKYGCRGCEEGITTAKALKQPIPGSIASPGTLAYVITAKYCDALPLYRQSVIFDRFGVDVSRSTLSHWMMKSAELLTPLYQAMRRQLLTEPILHADETTFQVLKEPDKAAQAKSYMWLYRTGGRSPHPLVLFEYQPGRGQCHPQQFLSGYCGYLQVDGYSGYNNLENVAPVGCWAHARRKFDEAVKLAPKTKQKTGKGMIAINTIQKLYRIEKASKDLDADARKAVRQAQALPILVDFKQWLEKSEAQGLPKSKMGTAITYCLNQWPKLMRYIEDGDLSIDNNIAERDIRPFTTGRKNWMFSQTPRGANNSAILYSLVLTARANNINPYRYLSALLTRLPNVTIDDDLNDLMPWDIVLD